MRSGSFGEQQTNSIFVLVAMFPKAKAVPDVALCCVRFELLPVSMPAIKCQHQIRAYLCEWKSVSKSVRAPELDCEGIAGESIKHLRQMSVESLAEVQIHLRCIKMNVSSMVRGSRSAFLKSAWKAVFAVNPRLNAKLEWVNGFSSSKIASSQGKSHLISAPVIRVGMPQKNRKAQSKSMIHVEVL